MFSYNHIFDVTTQKKVSSKPMLAVDKNSQKQYENIMRQIKNKDTENIKDVEIKPIKVKIRSWKLRDMCDKWNLIQNHISQYDWIKKEDTDIIQNMLIQKNIENVQIDKSGNIVKLNIKINDHDI
jgi:hypothetical protein